MMVSIVMMVSWSGKQLVKTFHHTTWPPFRLVVVSIFDFDDGEDFGDNGHDDNVDHDYDVESDNCDDHHDFDNDHQRRSWLLPSCARLRATSHLKISDQK